jgi:undecaprenyl diphosphate synthase
MRRVFGHREGVNSVRETVTECARMGVKSLTLYAFSVENWQRPRVEVRYLMRLLRSFLIAERGILMENGVRLIGIGRIDDLPDGARRTLRETEELTLNNKGMLLRLALSYGGRTELADATRALACDVQVGKLDPKDICEESLRAYLYDPETPDPDLLIRTAGEMRLSNFLLWQISYSELYVTDVCWPEFRKQHLLEAMRSFATRERRYGGLLAEASPATMGVTKAGKDRSA